MLLSTILEIMREQKFHQIIQTGSTTTSLKADHQDDVFRMLRGSAPGALIYTNEQIHQSVKDKYIVKTIGEYHQVTPTWATWCPTLAGLKAPGVDAVTKAKETEMNIIHTGTNRVGLGRYVKAQSPQLTGIETGCLTKQGHGYLLELRTHEDQTRLISCLITQTDEQQAKEVFRV